MLCKHYCELTVSHRKLWMLPLTHHERLAWQTRTKIIHIEKPVLSIGIKVSMTLLRCIPLHIYLSVLRLAYIHYVLPVHNLDWSHQNYPDTKASPLLKTLLKIIVTLSQIDNDTVLILLMLLLSQIRLCAPISQYLTNSEVDMTDSPCTSFISSQ